MALSARVLSKLAKLVGDWQSEEKYLADYNYLMDLNRFDNLHWSETKQRCFMNYDLLFNLLDKKLEKGNIKFSV